jgi:hypothetical protein
MNRYGLAALIVLSLVGPAWAQCPAPSAGRTADEIAANDRRLLCLQRELNATTSLRRAEMEMDAMEQRLRALEMQRQLDTIKVDIPVYTPPTP